MFLRNRRCRLPGIVRSFLFHRRYRIGNIIMRDSPIGTKPMGLLCIWRFKLRLIVCGGLVCRIGYLLFLFGTGKVVDTSENLMSHFIHLMYALPDHSSSTVFHLVGSIFVILRRNAVFCLALCLHIGILHPLSSDSTTVNGLYGAGYHISGLNLRHQNLPVLWQTHPHRGEW